MGLLDLPVYILQELSSGPYGPFVTQKLAEIHKWYEIYNAGAEFDVDDIDDAQREDFQPTMLRTRKIRRLISKQAEFMVGKSPDIKIVCPDEPKTQNGKPNEAAMQEYVREVLRKNLWSGKLLKGAKDCFIGGKVALKVNVSPDRLNIMFVPADGFLYETEPDDVDVVSKVILFYCVDDSEDKTKQRWWRQRYQMENEKCMVSESLHDGYGETIPGYEIKDRDTGLDRIPVYVIINDGVSGDMDGESEVETIADEDLWYSKMRSANLDTVRKTMNAITWVSGAKPESFEHISNVPGAIWDLQADPVLDGKTPEIGMLENSFRYSATYKEMLANINENMHDSLGIPDLSLEKTQGLMTSGKGLKMLYWPLICRCNAKWMAWKPALEWLTELLLYAAEIFPTLKAVYGDFQQAVHTVTIEERYPLPEDEAEERALDLQEVGTGRSIKSYLKEWGGPDHKGMSDEDADAEIEQMAKEMRMMEESFPGEVM